jgi:hypothetical protein
MRNKAFKYSLLIVFFFCLFCTLEIVEEKICQEEFEREYGFAYNTYVQNTELNFSENLSRVQENNILKSFNSSEQLFCIYQKYFYHHRNHLSLNYYSSSQSSIKIYLKFSSLII